MKKTLKGFLHIGTGSWNRGELHFYSNDMSNTEGLDAVMIRQMEIEVEVPDDFDPRPAQIKALQEKQKKAAADFHAMNTEIMRQIQELQALEMTV